MWLSSAVCGCPCARQGLAASDSVRPPGLHATRSDIAAWDIAPWRPGLRRTGLLSHRIELTDFDAQRTAALACTEPSRLRTPGRTPPGLIAAAFAFKRKRKESGRPGLSGHEMLRQAEHRRMDLSSAGGQAG